MEVSFHKHMLLFFFLFIILVVSLSITVHAYNIPAHVWSARSFYHVVTSIFR
jgi:hypothetical protein